MIDAALIGEPQAFYCWWNSPVATTMTGRTLARKLDDLAAMMGDLGVPGSVVR